MPANPANTSQNSTVRLVAGPELTEISFRKLDNLTEGDSELGFRFNLGLTRFTQSDLGVELSMDLDNAPQLTARIAYRAIFRIMSTPTESDAEERYLRRLGARVAPAVIYPFIRETFVAIFQKALFPPMVPPIINFETVFDLDSVQVPPVPEKSV